jgi:hypothetical protein
LTHLYKIKDKDGRVVTFKPNDIQLRHLAERSGTRFNRILKARQFGFTTLYSIDLLDESLWNPGIASAIIAHEAKKLIGYFAIVKLAFDNLPEELKPATKTDTKYRYDFLNRFDGIPLNSSIYVDTDIRGGTVQNLHVTEIAYIKDLARLAAGSKQAVPLTGRISEETTANGFNQFYDDFINAWNNPNPGPMDYRAYFYPWFMHSGYKLDQMLEGYTDYEEWLKNYALQEYNITVTDQMLAWRRWKMSQLVAENQAAGLSGEQLFKQEYPATIGEAFQSGAGNVFNTEKIDRTTPTPHLTYEQMQSQTSDPAILEKAKNLIDKGVRFWYLPQPGYTYVTGVDPSDGDGSDNGAIAVWIKDLKNIEDPIEKHAEYYGKLRPDELGDLAVEISQFYNNAYLGVENNMLSCILHISTNTGYSNYYFTTRIDEKTLKRTKKLGWNTNSKTRDVMIDDFIQLYDEDNLKINSGLTLSEMRTFVRKENGKREHANGKFDDMLFADFVAIQMRKYQPKGGRVFTHNPLG